MGTGTFGLDPVIQVLAAGSSEFDKKATAAITEKNPELAKRIRDEMFYFDDLLHIADKELERIISETPDETLVKALKGSVDSLAEKFFANMATRKRAQVQFQMNNLPPLRVSEIEIEQRQVVAIARRLQQQKLISLDRVAGSTGDVGR
jgi:flagellar motor switch protein FliG